MASSKPKYFPANASSEVEPLLSDTVDEEVDDPTPPKTTVSEEEYEPETGIGHSAVTVDIHVVEEEDSELNPGALSFEEGRSALISISVFFFTSVSSPDRCCRRHGSPSRRGQLYAAHVGASIIPLK